MKIRPHEKKCFSNQRVAGIPVRAHDDFYIERRAESRLKHCLGIAVSDVLWPLTVVELGMESKLVASVDRRHQAAAIAVYSPIHPGTRVRDQVVEF